MECPVNHSSPVPITRRRKGLFVDDSVVLLLCNRKSPLGNFLFSSEVGSARLIQLNGITCHQICVVGVFLPPRLTIYDNYFRAFN